MPTAFTIEQMFKEAHKTTSPDRTFMNNLEEWCIKTGKDFRQWQHSMYRLFTLKSKFPYSPVSKIVGYVLNKDKEALGL